MRLVDINKSFKNSGSDGLNVNVLKNFHLEIKESEFVSIVGPSGSGKSTLLNIMGLLDSPDSGSVIFEGIDLVSFSQRKRTLWRRLHLGFIFQFHYLLHEFTVVQNIALVERISGVKSVIALKEASDLLKKLGLDGKENKFPSELSGGEQQRVAIARAITGKPKLILADEPTGNLDHENALRVFEIFKGCAKDLGITVVMVTHNQEIAKMSDKIVSLY